MQMHVENCTIASKGCVENTKEVNEECTDVSLSANEEGIPMVCNK